MILRLGFNAAVHTLGGIILGGLAVVALSAAYKQGCMMRSRDEPQDDMNTPVRDTPIRDPGPQPISD